MLFNQDQIKQLQNSYTLLKVYALHSHSTSTVVKGFKRFPDENCEELSRAIS